MEADVKKITQVDNDYYLFNVLLGGVNGMLSKNISDLGIKKGYKLGVNINFSRDIKYLLKCVNDINGDSEEKINKLSKKVIAEVRNECMLYFSEMNVGDVAGGTKKRFNNVTLYTRDGNLFSLQDFNNSLDFIKKYDTDGWDLIGYALNLKKKKELSIKDFIEFNKGFCYIEYKKEGSNVVYPIIRFQKFDKTIGVYLDSTALAWGDNSTPTKILKDKIKILEERLS